MTVRPQREWFFPARQAAGRRAAHSFTKKIIAKTKAPDPWGNVPHCFDLPVCNRPPA